jgi:hypothetical protein
MERAVFDVAECARNIVEFLIARDVDATFPLGLRVLQVRRRCKDRLPVVLLPCDAAMRAQRLEACRMIQLQLAKTQEDRREIQRLRAGIGELNLQLRQLHQAAQG